MIGRCGMKFNYCQKIRFFFVISCVLATATQAFAQDADDIWAYRSTGKTVAENNDLDAEIFAAMQALDEVGTIIDDRANSTKSSTAKSKNDAPTQIQNAPQVDIDSLLAAANAPEQTQIIDAKKAIPRQNTIFRLPIRSKSTISLRHLLLNTIFKLLAPKKSPLNRRLPRPSTIFKQLVLKKLLLILSRPSQNTTCKWRQIWEQRHKPQNQKLPTARARRLLRNPKSPQTSTRCLRSL